MFAMKPVDFKDSNTDSIEFSKMPICNNFLRCYFVAYSMCKYSDMSQVFCINFLRIYLVETERVALKEKHCACISSAIGSSNRFIKNNFSNDASFWNFLYFYTLKV